MFRLASCLAVFAVLVSVGRAEVIFTKIADTATPMPGGGTFSRFGAVSLDGGNVAFSAQGNDREGIYTYIDGILDCVADTNTPVPGTTENFARFGGLSMSGSQVAFLGHKEDFAGIYTGANGVLTTIVDYNTAIPGGGGDFAYLSTPSVSGGSVAFLAWSRLPSGNLEQEGLFLSRNGVIDLLVGKSTPRPDGDGTFDHISFTPSGLDQGDVGFCGYYGIYKTVGGVPTKVADENTPVPGWTGTFLGFDAPSFDDGVVAFRSPSHGLSSGGVYADLDGELVVVADANTPLPDSTENFGGFGWPIIDGRNIAFESLTPSQQGIYLNRDGSLMKVVDRTDVLDGKRPLQTGTTTFSAIGLSGDSVLFKVKFEDESQALYLAEVSVDPPPPPIPDLDGDGFVGSHDLDIVRAWWGWDVEPGNTDRGDATGDGLVNSADLDIIRANWGATTAAAVPEPGAIFLALGGAVFVALRRRR